MYKENDGYRLVTHRSLINKNLMCGVPRDFFILNLGVGCVMVFNFHIWFFAVITLGLYLGAVPLTKKDPEFFDCVKRHIKYSNYGHIFRC